MQTAIAFAAGDQPGAISMHRVRPGFNPPDLVPEVVPGTDICPGGCLPTGTAASHCGHHRRGSLVRLAMARRPTSSPTQLPGAVRAAFPRYISPSAPTLRPTAPSGPGVATRD